MEADEHEPGAQPDFAPALRRGDAGADCAPEIDVDLDRRLDFIPILSPALVEEPRDPRFRGRLARALPAMLVVALIAAMVVAIGRVTREERPQRSQRLLARASGPLEPRDVPAAAAPEDRQTEERTRAPRRARVKLKTKQKPRVGGALRATVVVASRDPASTRRPTASARSRKTPSKSGGGGAGKKASPAPVAKAPPQPSKPLYHLYKGGKRNDHWFTTRAAERDDRIARGYEMVAVEGFIFGKPPAGSVTLNTDNGPLGYIYEQPRDRYIPLYMFRGYNGYGDLFTTDEERFAEYEEQGWNPYGIVGYVLPPG